MSIILFLLLIGRKITEIIRNDQIFSLLSPKAVGDTIILLVKHFVEWEAKYDSAQPQNELGK